MGNRTSRNPERTSTHSAGSRRLDSKRGRSLGLIVAAGSAALLLALGANGTLASWTSAVITNNTNTVAAATAVILQEVGPAAATCKSSDDPSNSFATCSTINKYGGTTTPLAPGGSPQVVDVTFKNIGAKAGTNFSLAPGTCTYSPTTGTPTPGNLCTDGDLTIAISCSPGATYSSASAWTDLAYAAAAPPTTTKTHTVAADLAVNAQWTCRFTVSLITTANINAQGVSISQPLTWTLT